MRSKLKCWRVFTFPKPKGEVSALKMISIFLMGGLCSVSTSAQVEPEPERTQPSHWSHWMSGGNVDLQKARLHFEAQADSRVQRGLVVSSHSSDGRGGWNSTEVFGRLLSLNLGGRPLVLGEAGLVWRCAATPMPTFGHMWVRATFLFMAVPAESTELSWIHPMTTIGTPVRHPGGFGILLMLAITGEVFGIDVLAPLGATDVWIDPSNPDHIWLATGDGNGGDTYSIGVLQTWDAGMSWAPLELAFEPSQGRRIHAISPTRQIP